MEILNFMSAHLVMSLRMQEPLALVNAGFTYLSHVSAAEVVKFSVQYTLKVLDEQADDFSCRGRTLHGWFHMCTVFVHLLPSLLKTVYLISEIIKFFKMLKYFSRSVHLYISSSFDSQFVATESVLGYPQSLLLFFFYL